MAGRLEGKTALITGASRGIGRAIAEAYAREGAHLVLSATTEAGLAETAASIANENVESLCLAADLSDPAAAEQLFEAAAGWRQGLDIVVNNAGIYIGKPFTEYDMSEFDRLMKVNVYAVFQLMQLSLRHMQARRYGKIVNISSTAGKWESPNQAAYNTTKHAVVGMSKCAALENAALGITVNTICPGMVDTDMFQNFAAHADRAGLSLEQLKAGAEARIPMGRFLEAQEIAPLAVYLGSDESAGMTGQTITISGGMRMG